MMWSALKRFGSWYANEATIWDAMFVGFAAGLAVHLANLIPPIHL